MRLGNPNHILHVIEDGDATHFDAYDTTNQLLLQELKKNMPP